MFNFTFCQNKNVEDIWSGKYKIKPHSVNGSDTINVQLIIIERALDAESENLGSKYKDDLKRWNMFAGDGLEKDSISLRRFLLSEEGNEYKEFGWTELHKSGKMNCLDGGHFFICSTVSGSKVKIGKEEFITKTGIFGIMLHKGLFDFYKIE